MPSLAAMSRKDVITVIAPTIEHLEGLLEGNLKLIEAANLEINEELHNRLMSGRITPDIYKEQIEQQYVELELRQKAILELKQQIQRFTQFQLQTQINGFVIENTITRDELKNLSALTKIQRFLTENKNEKLFLNTVLQTVESCKTYLTEKGKLDRKTIPILKKEEQYASNLLALLSTFKLDPSKSTLIDNYTSKLDTINAIADATHQDETLSKSEKVFINKLCNNVSKEIKEALNNLSLNAPIDERQIQQNIHRYINRAAENAQKIPITSGFKGIINWFCHQFNKEPVYIISNSSKITPTIDELKQELQKQQEEEQLSTTTGLAKN